MHFFFFHHPQEANKCKTELQYWRSKSPATTVSNSFGHLVAVLPENLPPIVENIGIKADNFNLSAEIDKENPVQINENIVDLKSNKETDTILTAEPVVAVPSTLIQFLIPESMSAGGNHHKCMHTELDKRPTVMTTMTDDASSDDTFCPIGSPKAGDNKRMKMDDELVVVGCGGGGSAARTTYSNNGSNDIKKARRVQSKIRCQTKVNNNKTRSK